VSDDRTPPVRGVLLDVDGTLVDSNAAHARAWADAFEEAGIEAPTADEIQRLIGMGGDKLLPASVGIEEDDPRGKQLSERRAEIFRGRYLPELGPTPGAAELVEELRRRGLRIGIATSAKPEELRGLLERAGIPTDLAGQAVSADEVEASKPDPDVVQAALAELGLPAPEVVFIGDTPYDVEAGQRAGVAVVGLRSGGWSHDELRPAVAVFDDPAELLEQLDDLLRGIRKPDPART
jgi:HAD superfamily hydrolase (TIGR01509 family)